MPPEPSLTVISLGGGVQSIVMALIASQGAFGRVPDRFGNECEGHCGA